MKLGFGLKKEVIWPLCRYQLLWKSGYLLGPFFTVSFFFMDIFSFCWLQYRVRRLRFWGEEMERLCMTQILRTFFARSRNCRFKWRDAGDPGEVLRLATHHVIVSSPLIANGTYLNSGPTRKMYRTKESRTGMFCNLAPTNFFRKVNTHEEITQFFVFCPP